MNLEDRVLTLLRPVLRPVMRVLSLRTIVIVGALSVVVTVITLGTWVWIGVTNDQYSQLDRRLDSVSSLGDVSTLLSSTRPAPDGAPTPDGNLVRTVRIGTMAMSVPPDVVLPELGNGYANTTIGGVEYRLLHLLETERQRAVSEAALDQLLREKQRRRAGRAVVVHVDDRNARETHLVHRALSARAVAIDVARVGLLDFFVLDARVGERGARGLRRHLVVVLTRARLRELHHSDADDVDLATHGSRSSSL